MPEPGSTEQLASGGKMIGQLKFPLSGEAGWPDSQAFRRGRNQDERGGRGSEKDARLATSIIRKMMEPEAETMAAVCSRVSLRRLCSQEVPGFEPGGGSQTQTPAA